MGMRLDKNYYKGDSLRIEGINSSGWWFTGGSSFMSNGYVIYKNGLDGNPPNPNAVLQGRAYDYRLFDQRSMDVRASYYQFISHLQAVADKAAANERKYLQLKLSQLQESDIEVAYLDKIEQAIKQEDYSAAYTLLLRRDKDLKEFQREINSNKNQSFMKTNEFFNSQFFKFISSKFEQQLEKQVGKDTRTISLDTDFESLVTEFFTETLNLSISDNQSLQVLKDTFVKALNDKFEDAKKDGKIFFSAQLQEKIINDEINIKLARSKRNNVKIGTDHILTKVNKKYKSPKSLADEIAYSLMKNIGKGLSTELYQIGAFGDIGAHALSAGKVTRNYTNYFGTSLGNLQQKDDIIIPEIFGGTVDIGPILENLYARDFSDQDKAFYEELETIMKNHANTGVGEFFEIAVSTKGYMSNYDLQIAGEGSFSNRLSILKELDLGGNMVNKLIFMLNNTTKSCMMEDRIPEIQDYLASVCVAWMWDNSNEIFDMSDTMPNNFHKIYLFGAGSAYFTASQILQQTIDRLLRHDEDNNKFVRVGITPPAVYGNYQNLCDKYSVEGIKDKDQWQQVLQQRWEEVKRDAMESGTISIHFNQEELNELLGNLKNILNQG